MSKENERWTIAYAHRIQVLAPGALRWEALNKANPDEPRFGSQSVDGGSRSTDSTSSVERGVLHPDPIAERKRRAAGRIALICRELELLAEDHRFLDGVTEPPTRQSTVSGCEGCGGPAVNGVSHRGHGPFCSRCYQSWYRFKAANDKGTLKQWQDKRNEAAA